MRTYEPSGGSSIGKTYSPEEKNAQPKKKKRVNPFIIIALVATLVIICTWTAVTVYKDLCGHEHDFSVIIEKVESSCRTRGYVLKGCSRCFETKRETSLFPDIRCNMKKEKTVREYTCTEDGVALYKCPDCGKIEERSERAQHNFVNNNCTVCGVVKANHKGNKWHRYEGKGYLLYFQNLRVLNVIPNIEKETIKLEFMPFCWICGACGEKRRTECKPYDMVWEKFMCAACKTETHVGCRVEF